MTRRQQTSEFYKRLVQRIFAEFNLPEHQHRKTEENRYDCHDPEEPDTCRQSDANCGKDKNTVDGFLQYNTKADCGQ